MSTDDLDAIEAGLPEPDPAKLAEVGWWGSLYDEALVNNTLGVPPYDVIEVANRIELALRGADAVLDLGCGTGRLTNHLASRFPWLELFGTDISEPALNVARESALANVRYTLGDGRDLPDTPPVFDAAYSVTVFQHIPIEATFGYIQQVRERLRPGGVFIFTVATGDVDEFLNHQIPDVDEFRNEISELFESVVVEYDATNDWTWITATKEQP